MWIGLSSCRSDSRHEDRTRVGIFSKSFFLFWHSKTISGSTTPSSHCGHCKAISGEALAIGSASEHFNALNSLEAIVTPGKLLKQEASGSFIGSMRPTGGNMGHDKLFWSPLAVVRMQEHCF
jgi:hypothetical protein